MIITRIRHIFPYLYYRCYQSMYKAARDRNPEYRALGFVSIVKATYVLGLLLMPLCAIGLNMIVAIFVYFAIIFILLLDRSTHEKYKEMMALWKEESESTRQKKLIFLIIFCVYSLLAHLPIILIMRYFSLIK